MLNMIAKNNRNKILFLNIYWVCACMLIIFIEESSKGFMPIRDDYAERVQYSSLRIFIIATIITAVAGFIIASFEVLYFNKILRLKSFGSALLIKTSFYLMNIFILVSLVVIFILSNDLVKPVYSSEVITGYVNYLQTSQIWMNLVYWWIVVFSSLFILQVTEKFGKGVLVNLLLGRYHQPRKETRIFMFLDLTSSSLIAEKLGSFKYSSFLKDFFNDMDEIINITKGAIYQFVGDEVIIIWKVEDGIENNNCVRLFFLAEEKINSLKDVYLEKYGVYPQFKAGLHYGDVIVTEVGASKQEIAYHGDTINTTARIRSSCKGKDCRLLISADLISLLTNLDNEYEVESAGIFNFKGKKDVLGLFRVYNKN